MPRQRAGSLSVGGAGADEDPLSSSSSSDGEGPKRRHGSSAAQRGGRRGSLLEQCGSGSPSGDAEACSAAAAAAAAAAAEAAAAAAAGGRQATPEDGEGEGVFEIRDFTTASSFERIAHQICLAAKRWSGLLQTSAPDEGGLLARHEFDHLDFKYDLLFQLVPPDAAGPTMAPGAAAPAPPSNSTDKAMGLHTFPMRAHRLQRWFGVQHFLVVSVREQNIDLDSARTVLSAAALAVQSVAPAFDPPLSCFVPVDSGRRRRYLGELVCGGSRTVYTVDQRNLVDPGLEHLEGLQSFFCRRFAADPEEIGRGLMIGARFTYLADAFDRPEAAARASESSAAPSGAAAAAAAGSPSSAAAPAASAEAAAAAAEGRRQEGGAGSGVAAEAGAAAEAAETEETDPVESMQLHCLWPSFPRDSFADNAVYSELDPRVAPYWKVRLMRADEAQAPLPLTRSLRNLLEFRKEARTVRSAEASMQPQVPKTALASLSFAIQESLESILLPTAAEIAELATNCLAYPITTASPSSSSSSSPSSHSAGGNSSRGGVGGEGVAEAARELLGPRLAGLRGGRPGTRLAKLAELSAKMRCFKGAVMLWCQVLAHLRRQWDDLEPPPPCTVLPPTRRVGARGVRTEHFESAGCVAQQKFEMLLQSVQVRSASSGARLRGGLSAAAAAGPSAAAAATELRGVATGELLLAPLLLHPALMTEDMVMQLDLAAASITDPAERAELHSRELRADVAAFKDANPGAGLPDFLEWRTKVLSLSLEPFPIEWLAQLWDATAPQAALSMPHQLFEPDREAEMALHYLENIEGTQLLLQVFRVHLCTSLEALAQDVSESGNLAYLRALRDRAVAACLTAFSGGYRGGGAGEDGEGGEEGAEADAVAAVMDEVEDFPGEETLQAALSAVEALEVATRLVASLRAKLPGAGEALVEELLTEGEAAVTSHAQRRTIEELFARSRVLAQSQGREAPDGRGVFESLPLAKEFVLLLQPPADAGGAAGAGGRASRDAVASTKRMYAEIRERHLRIALSRGSRLA